LKEDVMLNAVGEWILGAANDARRALILSGALNFVLALVLVGGSFAQLEWVDGRPWVHPAPRDARSQVAALFGQPAHRTQLRALLQEHGFYEISNATRDVRSITAATADLRERHELVRDLRGLAQRNEHPFDLKERNVVLTVSERKSVAEGRAAVCEREDDLSHKWLLVWNPDGRSGFDVQVSERVVCTSADKQLVEISREDWEKLGLEGQRHAEAVVRVYLHKPPELVGAGSATVANQDAAPTRM
jgi:hypothetical protein